MGLFKAEKLEKMENQGFWKELEIKICFLRQCWREGWRQVDEIKRNRFFCGMVYGWFFAIFYQKMSKFGFWLDDWLLAIKSKHLRDFLEVSYFPKVLSLNSFGNSWDNSWTDFLVIIIWFCFTYGEEKFC